MSRHVVNFTTNRSQVNSIHIKPVETLFRKLKTLSNQAVNHNRKPDFLTTMIYAKKKAIDMTKDVVWLTNLCKYAQDKFARTWLSPCDILCRYATPIGSRLVLITI